MQFGMDKYCQKIIVGNVCFIKDIKNNKLLLLKRNKEPMAGMYTGVGGKVRKNEGLVESCIREAKEETGLAISDIKLRGIVKTVLEGGDSSWILLVYTADKFSGRLIDCGEGKLEWVDMLSVNSYGLIGFIKIIMPYVLDESKTFEGIIIHNSGGGVIEDRIHNYPYG